jgi:hypothetical protein
MAETTTTPYLHLLTFALPAAHMPFAPQPPFHFGFQAFLQTAPYHLSDLCFEYCAQFWSESPIFALWHLQDQASYGYNAHDLISCVLCWDNHILQDDQVPFPIS